MYNEILKLRDMLQRADIPFDFDDFMDGYRLMINKDLWAVQFSGSYGHEQDKIEIRGGLTKRELDQQPVKGWLTADEVFKRFEFCYENKTTLYDAKTNYEWFMERSEKDQARIIVNIAYKLVHEVKNVPWNDKSLILYVENWFDKERTEC